MRISAIVASHLAFLMIKFKVILFQIVLQSLLEPFFPLMMFHFPDVVRPPNKYIILEWSLLGSKK